MQAACAVGVKALQQLATTAEEIALHKNHAAETGNLPNANPPPASAHDMPPSYLPQQDEASTVSASSASADATEQVDARMVVGSVKSGKGRRGRNTGLAVRDGDVAELLSGLDIRDGSPQCSADPADPDYTTSTDSDSAGAVVRNEGKAAATAVTEQPPGSSAGAALSSVQDIHKIAQEVIALTTSENLHEIYEAAKDTEQSVEGATPCPCSGTETNLKRVGSVGGCGLFVTPGDAEAEQVLHEPWVITDLLRHVRALGSVFGFTSESWLAGVNIFVSKSSTVAFNLRNTLYFNAYVHKKLYGMSVADGKTTLQCDFFPSPYWFVTACHELAHNKVSGHGEIFEDVMQYILVYALPAFQRAMSEYLRARVGPQPAISWDEEALCALYDNDSF